MGLKRIWYPMGLYLLWIRWKTAEPVWKIRFHPKNVIRKHVSICDCCLFVLIHSGLHRTQLFRFISRCSHVNQEVNPHHLFLQLVWQFHFYMISSKIGEIFHWLPLPSNISFFLKNFHQFDCISKHSKIFYSFRRPYSLMAREYLTLGDKKRA